MTVLVTGAAGTVGRYLAAAPFAEPLELRARAELDVADLDAVRRVLGSGRYSAVVNLAAATDVDRCEREPQWAYALNTLGAWNVALAAAENDVAVVQISTTGVFGGDGAPGPFSEIDRPAPPNVYARTKLAGEERVRDLVRKAYVLRTAWIMGGGTSDKKLVGKVRAKLLAGEPVDAVDDQYGSPTYAADLAHAIAAILGTGRYGLYHVTNTGVATRHDMVLAMKQILRSTSAVRPVPASAFPLPAPRPRSDASVSLALPAIGLGDLMRPWQDALRAYLGTW